MSAIYTLNRLMFSFVKSGLISEDEYKAYKALLDAVDDLRDIRTFLSNVRTGWLPADDDVVDAHLALIDSTLERLQ